MDAQWSAAIGGCESKRSGGTRSGNNSQLPAIALGMRNSDERFSESGAKRGFASAQAAFALAGSQHQTRCGRGTAGRALDCGGSNVPDSNAKRERRDAYAKGAAEPREFQGSHLESCGISAVIQLREIRTCAYSAPSARRPTAAKHNGPSIPRMG